MLSRPLCLALFLFPLWPAFAQDIQVYKAQDIQPYRAQGLDAAPAQEVKPAAAAQEVKPFVAEEAKACKPGLEVLTGPGVPAAAAVGTWKLTIPGVAYQTEDTVARTRTLHVSASSAGMGTLTVRADGRYTWTGSGRNQSGTLQRVKPQCGAKPGVSYWGVRDGREMFFFTVEGGGLNLYSASESFVATGSRAR